MTSKNPELRESKADTILYLAILFVMLTIPFSGKPNSVAIIVLSGVWLLQGHFRNIRSALNGRLTVHLLFYALFIIGLSYTEDLKNGWFQIEQKLSLLILPLIFSTIPKIPVVKFRRLLFLFAGICFLSGLYIITAGLVYNYRLNQLEDMQLIHFTNQVLAGYIGNHSTYFSLFIAFSVFITAEYAVHHTKVRLYRILAGILIILFLFLLGLLASRIVIVSVIVMSFFYLLSFYRHKQRRYLVVAGVVIIGALWSVFFFKSGYFKDRFSEVYNFDSASLIGTNEENGVTQRIFFWKNAVEIIERKPVLGHGTGDANMAFSTQYTNFIQGDPTLPESVIKAVRFFDEQNYNAHNQYLQIMIQLGVTGLISFMFLIIYSYSKALSSRSFLQFCFLSIVFITCLTECVLDRQSGIVFFTFFNSLFLFHDGESG